MHTYEQLKELPRGTKIGIRAGAVIRSTKNYREPITNKRLRVVNLHRVDRGWDCPIHAIVGDRDNHERARELGYDLDELKKLSDTDPERYYRGTLPMRKAHVVWSGTGRYWHETEIENVI